MNNFRCVIDENNHYKTFVLLEDDGSAYCYQLEDGERFIDTEPPVDIVKPKWEKKKWIETATPEEIEAAKPEPLPEEETEQSELEELAMELSEMVAMQAEEIAELKAGQEETNDAVMELTNLLS